MLDHHGAVLSLKPSPTGLFGDCRLESKASVEYLRVFLGLRV